MPKSKSLMSLAPFEIRGRYARPEMYSTTISGRCLGHSREASEIGWLAGWYAGSTALNFRSVVNVPKTLRNLILSRCSASWRNGLAELQGSSPVRVDPDSQPGQREANSPTGVGVCRALRLIGDQTGRCQWGCGLEVQGNASLRRGLGPTARPPRARHGTRDHGPTVAPRLAA